MVQGGIEDIEAGGFTTLFLGNVLCHFGQEKSIQTLTEMATWLSYYVKTDVQKKKIYRRLTPFRLVKDKIPLRRKCY